MIEGIDVSAHQGPINWGSVARAGKLFAFVKATQGDYYTNPTFATNRAGCHSAGVLVGAYHFFDPRIPVKKQIDFFCRVVGSIPKGELQPALDFESLGNKNGLRGAPIPRDDAIHAAAEWVDQVGKRLGRQPLIYSYPDFLRTDLGNTKRFAPDPKTGDPGWPLWYASYGPLPTKLPGGWQQFTFWQYSDLGHCPGIAGNVDLDRFNGDLDQLHRFAGLR